MDVARLKAFMAVMETRHFARAAVALGVSQPGVSKNIKALEAQLGVRLFERGRHGAEPTPFAVALARRAQLILSEGTLAEAEIAAMRGARKGRISFGAGLSMLPSIVPSALHAFHGRWPEIAVSVQPGVSTELFEALMRGELEFVISAPQNKSQDEELEQTPLVEVSQGLAVRSGHPLTTKPPQTLIDLSSYPWIASRGLGLWDRISRLFLESGLEPPMLFLETPSDVLAKALLIEGDYICVLGRELYAREAQTGVLQGIPFAPLMMNSTVYLTRRKRSPLTTQARNMVMLLRQVTERHKAVTDR